MKQLMVVSLFMLLIMPGCQSRNAKNGKESSRSDTAKFFATTPFFKSQIQYVDLRSFSIYKITVVDGKKDSVGLTKEDFSKWAAVFLDKDVSTPEKAPGYKESVFNDLSTRSITLNYSPLDGEATIQNIDVLLEQETSHVKRILIKSVYNHGDTTVTEQDSWKTDKSFQVNRSYTTPNGFRKTELNYINWNDKP
jgi:hypothetical protein